MLISLTIKNFTLIDSEEIEFRKGLNILSGETGAGKSIILGALSIALGGKTTKDMVRDPESEAYVEAIFTVEDEKKAQILRDMGVEPYDGQVILSRKISDTRAQAKINGESVPSAKLKTVGELLIDIYGQNEHQSLLKKSKHLEIIDEYGGEALLALRKDTRTAYNEYSKRLKELADAKANSKDRDKDLLFLQHETEEIENAGLKPGEDESLEDEYRRMKNGEKIVEALDNAYNMTGDSGDSYSEGENASSLIGKALLEIRRVSAFDDRIEEMCKMLSDADAVVNDFNRTLQDYLADSEFDPEHFHDVEDRLDVINDLKNKYGNSIELILNVLNEKSEKIRRLEDYDNYLKSLENEVKSLEDKYIELSGRLSDLRRTAADGLTKEVSESLKELNFSNVEFEFPITETDDYTANGRDEGEFMISLNLGEELKPLRSVASGGELSRISLAIKTAVTERDGIDTLIFDEIDAGISGRTAQKVSEKLSKVAASSQVICITHLPQIASMADTHFVVEKYVKNGETVSSIKRLSREDRIDEISRMIGGVSISEKTRESAEELLDSAEALKKGI
jgi:DNA repair protein RecN (Recombination protein N)